MVTFKRTLGIVLGLCFVGFAVVQYNDPDPALWVTIYGIAAALSIAAGFGKVSNTVLAVACVIFAVGVIYWWPEQYEGVGDSMRDATTGLLLKNVEEGRESLGMALCSIAMLSFVLVSRLSNSSKTTNTAP